MRRFFFNIAILCVSVLFVTSCSNSDDFSDESNESLAILKVTPEDGITAFVTENICPVLDVTTPLTADEIEFLYAMREDEKLARDLYTAFAAKYPASFQYSRIAVAESTHIQTVEMLLSYYEIEFPALGQAGMFADTESQTKYNELLARGITQQAAYEVMAMLEEENIAAYQAVEANITNVNIKLIVFNMIKASSNHMKAAIRQITKLGGIYTPSILDQTTFDNIINSAFAQGNKYCQQMGKDHRGGNTNSKKGSHKHGNKGHVNGIGTCTSTPNGGTPGSNCGKGQVGKGYRGGR